MRPQRPRRSDHQCRLPTGDAPTVDLSPRRQEADAKAAAEAEPPKEPEPVPAPAPVADEPVFEPAPAPEAAPSPVAEPAPAPAPAKPSSASKKKPLTKEAIEKMTVPTVWIKILRRVRAESSRRPPRHRRDAGCTRRTG